MYCIMIRYGVARYTGSLHRNNNLSACTITSKVTPIQMSCACQDDDGDDDDGDDDNRPAFHLWRRVRQLAGGDRMPRHVTTFEGIASCCELQQDVMLHYVEQQTRAHEGRSQHQGCAGTLT